MENRLLHIGVSLLLAFIEVTIFLGFISYRFEINPTLVFTVFYSIAPIAMLVAGLTLLLGVSWGGTAAKKPWNIFS